ncbi:winged helix-turn-helix transcriptional regulator [Amycolatopsis sp. NBC_01480]|uniref:winged helix-turn-helix transcriptional regulator n=1 Tax=Amycolatopsis sp. NBC_01480 TaxID=2903562 RepID=UPI002E2C24AA|nr:helix-turn-helix domain-containing protein [Amycolatopsis sp. NBC_01480]
MKRTDTSAWPCTIARATTVFGDHWNVLLLREAFYGVRRFEDFQRSLGIGRGILTERLSGLVHDGLLVKVEYQDKPVRHEYRLTGKGRDAFPVLMSMAVWADRHMVGPEGTPVIFEHKTCGYDLHIEVACSHCGDPVDLRETGVRWGPGHPSHRQDDDRQA